MLEKIVSEDLLKAHGVVGLFPASSEGDDIAVYDVEGEERTGTLHGLRQQVRHRVGLVFILPGDYEVCTSLLP